jgi:hypothetical protein
MTAQRTTSIKISPTLSIIGKDNDSALRLSKGPTLYASIVIGELFA